MVRREQSLYSDGEDEVPGAWRQPQKVQGKCPPAPKQSLSD